MRKSILQTILFVLVLTTSLFITGCGNDSQELDIENPIEVTISITYPTDAEQENVTNEEIKIEENSTVNDALQLYCNVSNIPTTTDTTSSTVISINNVNNGDFTETATWKYKLDGKLCSDPSGSKILGDGDELEWIYE